MNITPIKEDNTKEEEGIPLLSGSQQHTLYSNQLKEQESWLKIMDIERRIFERAIAHHSRPFNMRFDIRNDSYLSEHTQLVWVGSLERAKLIYKAIPDDPTGEKALALAQVLEKQ